MMSRKHCYLLLELMIAFTILGILVFPLIKPLFSSLETEALALENIRLRRSADIRFADFKAALLSDQIPKEALPKEKGAKVVYKKTSVSRFEETIYLKLKRNQTNKEGKESSLYQVEINYKTPRKKSPIFRYEVMAKDA